MQRMGHPDANAKVTRGTRVTTKDFWSLAGSATGYEAIAMAKRKVEEKQRKEAEVDDRRSKGESKRRRKLTEGMKQAEELLQEISRQGPPRVASLVLKDIQALLLHDRPDGTAETKGSRSVLLPRVAGISGVVRALQHYDCNPQRVAAPQPAPVAPPPVIPPMPPPPQPREDAPGPHEPPESFETLQALIFNRTGSGASSAVMHD